MLAKVLRCDTNTITHIANGRAVTASLAVRVARLAGVSIDGLLRGDYPPPGTCPYCGHCAADGATNAGARDAR
jgi:hypothetical protein